MKKTLQLPQINDGAITKMKWKFTAESDKDWNIIKKISQKSVKKEEKTIYTWTHTFNLMPRSCKNVQYDFRRYVSFFKSILSLLDGEFSSISFLEKYQRPPSSGLSWELLDGPLSEFPQCEDSPGNAPAIIFQDQD
jgi:hypothetical protein